MNKTSGIKNYQINILGMLIQRKRKKDFKKSLKERNYKNMQKIKRKSIKAYL